MMFVMEGILYTSEGVPVMPNLEAHQHYREAYKRLFGRMGQWPPDGLYSFDGEEMALVSVIPWARMLGNMEAM